ncbi:MAG: LuxR C-terminal-related transcriptional regulator [Solirubrobacteraceae bacterium]
MGEVVGNEVEETWCSGGRVIADPRLADDLRSLLDAARSSGLDDVDPRPRDVEQARAALARVIDRATERLVTAERVDAATRRAAGDVLLGGRELDERLLAQVDHDREASFGAVRDALGVLREVTTGDQMVERAPTAISRLGFDRAIVSAVEDACFIPRGCFISGDDAWAAEVVRAGQAARRRLDRTLAETEIVRRRTAIRVLDVQADPNVHREIADVSQSRSYVAAPIIAGGHVVGFLHADYFHQRRTVSELDRDVLWMFAEAYGQAFERAVLVSRMDGLRRAVRAAASTAEDAFTWAFAEPPSLKSDLGGRAIPGAMGEAPVHDIPTGTTGVSSLSLDQQADDVLTRRELEVLRLMAAGMTNGAIADRLVISHGTVKTHVKHILRKLRAANRAEAVSRYLQIEHRRSRLN